MSPPPLEILVINLDRAPERWAEMRTALAGLLSAAPAPVPVVTRLAATDGSRMTWSELRGLVAPAVLRRLDARHRVCDPLVLDSRGAVGAYHSHLRCWERLAVDPNPAACALVLEDDVCPTAELLAAARGLAAGPWDQRSWDAVQLGWMWMPSSTTWWRPRRVVAATDAPGPLTTWERDSYGAHAYVVGREGARRLVRHARPLELHVDHFLAVASVLGIVRGRAWPRSLTVQCRSGLQAAIPHWTSWSTTSARLLLPDARFGTICLLLLLVVASAVCVRRNA